MKGVVLLDTGQLVSFLAADVEHSEWVVEQCKQLRPPLVTCEPVLTEAAFLLKREGMDTDVLFELLERGVIKIAFEVDEHLPELRALMRRYRDRPMSLADACLVRMSEVFKDGVIFTLDDDFLIYRRHGSKTIPVLMPYK